MTKLTFAFRFVVVNSNFGCKEKIPVFMDECYRGKPNVKSIN